MPIFWFALVGLESFSWFNAAIVFVVLHVFVYPASNGYNSYFDKDEGAIGGLEKPPKVNRELYYLVLLFDLAAILLSLSISSLFAALMFIYLLVSKAYSWDKIRLKKYPILSTVVVTVFQGAFTFMSIRVALTNSTFSMEQGELLGIEWSDALLAITATFFLCGSYPITQIYQHDEDSKRGDKSLSLLLGIKGTFAFSGLLFTVAIACMSLAFIQMNQLGNILLFAVASIPVLSYFSFWFMSYLKGRDVIDFRHTMRMNKISSICLSLAFIGMLLLNLYYYPN